MYTPSHFALEDDPAAQRIMRKYNFATLVSGTQTDVMASHLPLLWTSQGGQYGSLRGHMARENPQWKQFADGGEILAIFLSDHAYISPNWYVSGPAVPTWNYSAVHAYGTPSLIEETCCIKDLLRGMVEFEDPDPGNAWPDTADYKKLVEEMIPHIVAFDISIVRLHSKAKLSQNRPETDRRQVMDNLRSSANAGAQKVAEDMEAFYGHRTRNDPDGVA